MPAPPSGARPWYRATDWVLVGSVAALAGLGLVMVYSATRSWAPDPIFYLRRQAINLGVGALALVVAAAVDYRRLLRYGPWVYLGGLLLLAAVLVAGRRVAGTQGWLALGRWSLQPAELAKVALAVALAGYLAEHRPPRRWPDLVAPTGLALVYTALVLLQPDLGTAVVFVVILMGMLFAAQTPAKFLAWMTLAGLAAVGLAVAATWAGWWPLLKPHQLQRLAVLVQPGLVDKGAGWNVLQSVIAVGSGRLFGRGLFAGPQTQLAFLPSRHTDFIFSAVGEELGFLGAGAVLAAYYLVCRRILRVAQLARDRAGSLLAVGVLIPLSFHVVVNIGMTLALVPVMGIPLPFLSYGGSNLVASLTGVGLVLSVARRRRA